MSDSPNPVVNKTFELPAAAGRALELIEELHRQSKPFNAAELRDEFNQTLWWGTEPESPEAEEQARQRVLAGAWALQELAVWTPQLPLAWYRLQIVLTTLLASSPSDREAMEAITREMVSPPLLDGLLKLLKATSTGTQSRRRRFCDQEREEETLAAGRSGDYRKLGNLIRHLEVELPPDVHLAVLLLMRFAPERLAHHISERQDAVFSIAVRDALGENALEFSRSVNDVTFKFVCASPLANTRLANAPEGSVEAIRELLLQVAQTELWRAWLLDFAHYPQADTVAEKALSEALAQLTPAHWSAFVDAVELWTYAGTAGPVARILVPVLHALGDERSVDLWRFAFERWDKWNYGHDEKDKHLLAPSSCSFDFPVAMHYALLPLEQVQAEEAELQEGIANAEQKWFSGFSDLVTYRNRLSSRLRLVQHGLVIRNPPPGGAGPLPPPIEPESEFAEIRYRFFDTSARMRRGR